MGVGLIVLLVLIAGAVAWVAGIYNKLVALRNRFQNAFSQIEVQLKRRYDLIPNLVETAKAYMAHERDTLEAVIAARNRAFSGLQAASGDPSDAGKMAELGSAESALGGALGQLRVTVEAYPELKANENMMQLNEELTTTENRVAFARQGYNDGVTAYNTFKQSFPAVLFAASFGHAKDAPLLAYPAAEREAMQEAPKVSF